jgi:hypothetical protein
VQWRNGKPTPIYPQTIAAADAVWPKSS